MDILALKKAYLVGIKGSGVSALACILKNLGIKVVGSDTKEKFFTDEILKKERIKFYEGFKKENLKRELPVSAVISSVAYLSPDPRTNTNLKQTNANTVRESSFPVRKSSRNPEIELAKKLNIPILTYPQALAEIFNQSFGIAICGSHGKSSTTAILGKVFKDAGLDPTVLVGSEVIEWKSNALVSKNFKKKIEFLKKNKEKLKNLNWLRKNLKNLPIFIIEADEYKEAFLNYFPRIIIITNIDYDHPDYFKTEKEYKDAFRKFIENLKEPGILIVNHADIRRLDNMRINTIHGLNGSGTDYTDDINHYQSVLYLHLDPRKSSYNNIRVYPCFNPRESVVFPFPYPGSHWQKNLRLIYQLIKILKIPEKIFLKSIKNYQGIKRRFEIVKHTTRINTDFKRINTDNMNKKYPRESALDPRKSVVDIYLIDDYAHHPSEVLAYFKSLKKLYPDYQIYFLFQPHTFTRTHFLFNQFIKVFKEIKKDKKTNLIIFKTFPSAREKEIILKIKKLKKDIDLAKKVKALYFDQEKKLIDFLQKNLKEKTIITTVGAGNLYKILSRININAV
jgi:UDP-N-acetylmuramate--alanine ligase